MRISSLIMLGVVSAVTAAPVLGQQTLTLQSSLQRARKNNPDLRVSEYSINAAEADITTATIRPNPIFNTQLLQMTNPHYFKEGTTWPNVANGQYWFQVTKPFQLPGQRSNKIEYSKKQFIQSRLDYNETVRNVLAGVANKWLDVWAAQINLEILRKGKGNIDTLVQINELRLRNQVITSTDLLRAQLLQHQYERDIITAGQDYANELERLRYMLGTTDSFAIDVSDNIFNSINTAGDSLIAMGTHERTDVLSAKNAVDASMTNIKLQRAMAYPQPEAGVIWNPQNTISYIGLYGTIKIPVFDRNQGFRQKAETQRLQSEQNLLATEKQAETEVSTAYRTYVIQRRNMASFQQNLQQAETILSNVRYAYLKGGTSIIDLLEAQRSWLDTQQRYYQTLGDFRRSYIQLLYATGLLNQIAE